MLSAKNVVGILCACVYISVVEQKDRVYVVSVIVVIIVIITMHYDNHDCDVCFLHDIL